MNREARRRQRENPKFREVKSAGAYAYYVRPCSITFDVVYLVTGYNSNGKGCRSY